MPAVLYAFLSTLGTLFRSRLSLQVALRNAVGEGLRFVRNLGV